MAVFDVTEAVSYLGKTVLIELVWDEDPEPLWCIVRIAGVVLSLEGVYEHPHFMVFSVARPQTYPDEMLWSDIRTIKVIKPKSGTRKASRNGPKVR